MKSGVCCACSMAAFTRAAKSISFFCSNVISAFLLTLSASTLAARTRCAKLTSSSFLPSANLA